MAIKLGDALLYLGADDDKLKKDLNQAETKTKGWGATMTGVMAGIGFGIVGAVGSAISGAMATIGESISLASDLAETQSKVNTLFGDQAAWITEWAESAAGALGMTKQAALDSAAGIGNMFMQMGIGGEVAADAGVGMVELAADIASFHNVAGGATEVMDALSAAFRGEYDSLQKYVPMINAAAVEQRALADTGKESAKELTAAEKALATYSLTMEGAGAAVGDFERTSDGFSNSMRVLNAYWEEFKTLMGETLLPVLTPLVQKVKELADQYLPMLADYIHESIIPAIEEWAAHFDDWWADHAEPFIKSVQTMWDAFVAKTELAMGDTEEKFGLNMATLEAAAGVAGVAIGTALGDAMIDNLEQKLSTWASDWWKGFLERLFTPGGGLFGGPGDFLNQNPQFPLPVAPVGPNMGPSTGGFGMQSAPAVTINNYVDAQSRSVGEAARDGTLEGLRQAGMR